MPKKKKQSKSLKTNGVTKDQSVNLKARKKSNIQENKIALEEWRTGEIKIDDSKSTTSNESNNSGNL